MKRLIVCCDGTWQSPRSPHPTNIVRLVELVPPCDPSGTCQQIFYDEGVGTRNAMEKYGGGAFGWGLDASVEAAYRFLCLNFQPGDEIYLFGFSRGAYTVRSLGGLLYNCDILHREHIRLIPEALSLYRDRRQHPRSEVSGAFRSAFTHAGAAGQRTQVTALGCFDTVGSLGIPDLVPHLPLDKMVNRKYEFNDTKLSPIIRKAFHALALEEHRKVFDYTPMEAHPAVAGQLRQVWFSGDHGCVGGGSLAKEPLSNIPLHWMLGEITAAGLGLYHDAGKLDGRARDPLAPCPPEAGIFALLGKIGPIDREVPPGAEFHPTVLERRKALGKSPGKGGLPAPVVGAALVGGAYGLYRAVRRR